MTSPETPEPQSNEPGPYEPLTPYRLLFGESGLRAGWCVLLFLCLRLIFNSFGHDLFLHFHPLPPFPREGPYIATPGVTLWMETTSLVVVLGSAWLVSLATRPRSFGSYGLGGPHRLGDLLAGLGIGLGALSLLVACLHLAHLLAFDGVALHGRLAVLYGLKWGITFLAVGCFEEFLTRGFLQYTVARGVSSIVSTLNPANRHRHAIGFWVAAVCLSGLLFMGLHLANGGESPIGILAVGIAGLTFAFSLWRTGTLWWAIGFHAAWDWAQSYLYGVADSGGMVAGHLMASHPTGSPLFSGGATGPEGSIFVIPTLLLVCGVIHLTLARRVYPLPPEQRPPVDAASIYTQP